MTTLRIHLIDGLEMRAFPENEKQLKKIYKAIATGAWVTLHREDGTECTVNPAHVVYTQTVPASPEEMIEDG